MAHTPGPYALKQESVERDWSILTAPGGRIIANVHLGNEVDMANARLIAAAPELLEACKLAFDYYRSIGSGKYNPYEVEQSLEKAIAKAEGVQP